MTATRYPAGREPTGELPRGSQSRLVEALLEVGGELDLDAALHRIVTVAADLTGARYGSLVLLEPAGTAIEALAHTGLDAVEAAAIGDPRSCRGPGLVAGEPLRLAGLAASPRPAGVPPGHPRLDSVLGVPVRVRDTVLGTLLLANKTGPEPGFSAEDERLAVVLSEAAGQALDHARSYQQARHRERWQEAAAGITRLLLSGAGEVEVLTAITALMLDLIEASDVLVLLPLGEDRLQIVAGTGPVAGGPAIGFVVPQDGSVSGRAYRQGVALNLTEDEVAAALRANPGLPGMGPAVVVPFGSRGRVRGVLAVSRRPGSPPFPGYAVPAIEAFAVQAELAYELTESRRRHELLSLYADRDRIARNLHDLVIQRLFAAGLVLESAAHLAGVDPLSTAGRIRNVVADIDGAIKELRTTIFALQHPGDDAGSLRTKVLDVIDAASAPLGLTPSVRFDGLIDTIVDENTAEQLVAVLREALSNAARHANASAVQVTVSARDQLTLTVADNGIGLNLATTDRRSGLANMSARAERLGGHFTIHPARPGTQLRWCVPLTARTQQPTSAS